MYALTVYFSEEARRTAAAQHYVRLGATRSCEYGGVLCCPAGVMAMVDGYTTVSGAPSPGGLMQAMAGRPLTAEPGAREIAQMRLRLDAMKFMLDWDAGTITDLADALGVSGREGA